MSQRQQGAISIEFVLLFPLFLVVFYAILSYGVSFAQLHVLNGMAAKATQAARAVVIESDESNTRSALSSRVASVIDGGIIAVDGCAGGADSYYDYVAATGELTICLETAVLLPSLDIFGIRIPDIESPLRSQSSVRLGRLGAD